MKGSILGVGIDTESISRFKKLDLKKNNKFLSRIFTQSELDYCFGRKNIASSLTTKYSAKEAVIKALNFLEKTIDYKDIEVKNDKNGAPFVNLPIEFKNYSILISLSNTDKQAIAVAIIVGK